MANKLFYSYIHKTNGKGNASYIPEVIIHSYWDSLVFDVNHRTIWHKGMPFGNVYPGTLSYGEVFNDFDRNIAYGAYSHAEGSNTYANGDYSHAEGYTVTYKEATYSHAEGKLSYTYGEASHAEGSSATLKGAIYSHAEGSNTFTGINAVAAHAEGNATQANGEASHAEGNNTNANGIASHAEGKTTRANGQYSHTEGNATQANGQSSHAEGYGTLTGEYAQYSHVEGEKNSVVGPSSHVEGKNNRSNGEVSHVEGENNVLGNGAPDKNTSHVHIEGTDNVIYNSKQTHIEGVNNQSNVYDGLATNKNAISSGLHIEGVNNNIYGSNYVHVEGGEITVGDHKQTKSFDLYTHAEGYNNNVYTNVRYSHIEGSNNTLESNVSDSHVGGHDSIVKENVQSAFIHGIGDIAKNDSETIFGNYNVSYVFTDTDDNTYTVFSVGVGTSDVDRKNAIDIRSDNNGDESTYIYNSPWVYDDVNDYGISQSDKTIHEILQPKLRQVATLTYVQRNSTGRKNLTVDENGVLVYEGAEYYNNYDGRFQNKANGDYSHAEGYGTKANAPYTHVEGFFTIANNPYEHAGGLYNVSLAPSDISKDYTMFSIGNGTSDALRSNAFEIRNIYDDVNGYRQVGLISNESIVTNAHKFGGNIETTKIWKGTLNEYMNESVSPDTLYFISDSGSASRNDIITENQLNDIKQSIMNEIRISMLSGTIFNANMRRNADGKKSFESSSNITYIWQGTKQEYDRLTPEQQQYADTAFLIVGNSNS